MQRDVRRQRATHAVYPSIPDNGDTLFDIPQRFTVNSTGYKFLNYDNHRADRILIFGTGRSLYFLQNYNYVYTSGLWTGCSKLYHHSLHSCILFMVHGLSHGRHIAGAY